jgi:hypothetical protein
LDFLRLPPSSFANVIALMHARVADVNSDADKITRKPEVTSWRVQRLKGEDRRWSSRARRRRGR